MKKKYIIALEDRNVWSCGLPAKTLLLSDVSIFGTDLASVNTGIELTTYTEPDLEQVKKDYDAFYEQGLADAWDAARKIYLDSDKGGLAPREFTVIFDNMNMQDVFAKLSASDCIEKIRQYEHGEKITKGDVVRIKSAPEVEILVTYADEEHVSGIALTEVDGNCEIGDQYTDIVIHKVEKTGKHYEIAEVLQKMREE